MNKPAVDSLYQTYKMSGDFDSKQLYMLEEGIKAGVDTSIYANKELNYRQMEQILLGLLSDLDVSVYANPVFSCYQMLQIRTALEHHLSKEQITLLADPVFDEWQISQIRVGFEVGIPAEKYANPSLSWQEMRKEYERLCKEKHRLDQKISHAKEKKIDIYENVFPIEELLL